MRAAWIVTAVAVLFGAAQGAAQEADVATTPAPDPTARAGGSPAEGVAREHFERGVTLFAEENYQAALAEFLASYEAFATARVMYNIAMTYKALFQYDEAGAAFRRFLALRSDRIAPDERAEVEGYIEEMERNLVDVTVEANVAGAVVLVDGRDVGTTPLPGPLRLGLGRHTISARAADHEPAEQTVTVLAGEPVAVSLDLRPVVTTGRVVIECSTPGAALRLDGVPVESGFPYAAALPQGGHSVVVEAEGFLPYRGELGVTAGRERRLDVTLDPIPASAPGAAEETAWYESWWFWTAVTVAAGGAVATGVVLGTRDVAELPGGTWPIDLE